MCAVATGLMGRIFGVLELYFLAAALGVAAIAGWLTVTLRRPRVTVRRWVRPEVLTAGDTGRVDVLVRANGSSSPFNWRPSFQLVEAVGDDRTARMTVAPIRGGRERSAGYRVPTERRGVLHIGPLVAVRHDLLGLARSISQVAGIDEILVAPRAFELAMPELGDGILGRHLLAQSVRLGPGEFHSLREYVPGDEPRTIHWRASARSDELKVRQHSAEGLRRCTVVLDQQVPEGDDHDEAFERAVVAAASLVHSSDRVGLQTRFATTAGVDLRGPTVSVHTLHHLARVTADPHPPMPLERDPGEGLGLVFVITPDAASTTWQTMDEMPRPDPHPTRRVHRVHRRRGAPARRRHQLRTPCSRAGTPWSATARARPIGRSTPSPARAARRSPYDGQLEIDVTALVDHSGAIDTDRAGDDRGGDANEPFEVARGLDLAATVALLAYSIAVAVGFSRVFVGHDFLRDLVLIAVIGHGTSYLLRLLRVPAFVAIPLVLVVLTWTVAWIYYPATFSGPFPLSATWETVRADFHVIQSEFQTATAPVPYSVGLGVRRRGDDGCRRAGWPTRLPSAPRHAARPSCPVRCSSCSSPRSASTRTVSRAACS